MGSEASELEPTPAIADGTSMVTESLAASESKFIEVEFPTREIMEFTYCRVTVGAWFCQLGLAPFDHLIWPHLSY
jgi:hypothetical protein